MALPVWRVRAGGLVLVACLQYPIAEAVAAAAWRQPRYSYVTNYISDLGVVGCTPVLCSPLASVMNAGFVVSGLLVIAAAILLGPLIVSPGWRFLVRTLFVIHGLGVITVGLVHSAPHTLAGTPWPHLAGAYAAILGGNLALCSLAGAARQSGAARTYAAAIGLLGLFGLLSGVALVAEKGWPSGLLERAAADTITPAEAITGAVLLLVLRRKPGEALVSMPSLKR